MAADQPVATAASIPEAVRKLELEAISLYRSKYPDGIPWQELAHTTRSVWVAYTEAQRTAGVSACSFCKGTGTALLTGPGGGYGTCPDCHGTGNAAGAQR